MDKSSSVAILSGGDTGDVATGRSRSDQRVISTSSCDQRRRVEEGAFRADLYCRLDGR